MKRITTACHFLLFVNFSFAQTSSGKMEIVEERDMFSNTYVNNNGGKETVLSNSAVNYNNDGIWEPIVQELIPVSNQYDGFENTRNALESFFPGVTGNDNRIKLTTDNGDEIFIHSNKKQVFYEKSNGFNPIPTKSIPSSGTVSNNTITYSNIYQGISDEFSVLNGMVKNNIILDNMPTILNNASTGYYGFQEELELPAGWTITSLEGSVYTTSSALNILNENGEIVLTIPEPIFFDNDNASSDGSNTVEGKYVIFQEGDVWVLSTLVPVEWLKSQERAYPVTIDPTVSITGNTGGWMSANNLVNNPNFVFIGVCCGNMEHRAWIKFSTAGIPDGSCVTDVSLEVFVNGVGSASAELVHAYDMTGAFGPYGGINAAVLADMANGYYTSFTINGAGTYGYYDLGASADALLQSQLPGDWYQVALIFDNEPSTAWKRITATLCKLSVSYDDPPCTPLPIELAEFSANCEQDHTKLSWTTISEMNNDHFEIEKTYDQVNFTTIASVNGVGTSVVTNNYSFTDPQIDERNAYYRLSQVDVDGTTIKYDIIASNCQDNSIEMSMNNFTNMITVYSGKELEGTYEIFNTIGQSVQSGNLSSEIPFTKVAGIYFVHFSTSGETYKIEILKN